MVSTQDAAKDWMWAQVVRDATSRHEAVARMVENGGRRARSHDELIGPLVHSADDVPKLAGIITELVEEIAQLRDDRQQALTDYGRADLAVRGLRDRLQRATHEGHRGPLPSPIRSCLNAACVELRREFGAPFPTSGDTRDPEALRRATDDVRDGLRALRLRVDQMITDLGGS